MKRFSRAVLAAAALAPLAPLAPWSSVVAADGVDGAVDVAGLVVAGVAAPSQVVAGNTPQTVTVTVRNDLPRPLRTVSVSLEGIDSDGPRIVEVPAASSRPVEFRVVPCRAGTNTLTASARATDGSTTLTDVGDPVSLQVATGSTCSSIVTTPAGPLTINASAGRMVDPVVVPLADLPTPPRDMALPYGAISFSIEDVSVGAAVTVTLTAPGPAAGYAKFAAGGWTRLPSAVAVGSTVTFVLVDGGVGDADGVANGRIDDPGAVIAPAASPSPPAAPPSPSATTTTTPVASTPTSPAPAITAPATTSTSVSGDAPPSTTAVPDTQVASGGPVPVDGAPSIPSTSTGSSVVVGVVAGLGVAVGLIVFITRRQRRRRQGATP
jgi:hypothetical protein